MGRRRGVKRAKNTVGTDATHPDHPNLKAHVKAVKAGLRASEKLHDKSPVSLIEALRPYVLRARAISLVVSPFLDLRDVLWDGVEVKDRQADAEDAFYPEEYLHIVDEVMPGRFHKVLRQIYKGDECSDDEDDDGDGEFDEESGKELAGTFIDLLHDSYKSGRTDCTGNLKRFVPQYLTKSGTLSRPLVAPSAKQLRGFNHVDFGAAIVGIQYREEYRADPQLFCAEVNNGTRNHVYDSLPSFLYADDKEYNLEVPEEGLGTGHLLERCLRLELTGESTAFGQKSSSGKPSKAFMWGIKQMTAEIIASIVVQIYIAASSMSEFDSTDGKYDIYRLHQSVLRIFRSKDAWTKATLQKLTDSIPELLVGPKSKKTKGIVDDKDLAAIPDPADTIFEKRKERAAAAQDEERRRREALAKEEERKKREAAAREKERKRQEAAAREAQLRQKAAAAARDKERKQQEAVAREEERRAREQEAHQSLNRTGASRQITQTLQSIGSRHHSSLQRQDSQGAHSDSRLHRHGSRVRRTNSRQSSSHRKSLDYPPFGGENRKGASSFMSRHESNRNEYGTATPIASSANARRRQAERHSQLRRSLERRHSSNAAPSGLHRRPSAQGSANDDVDDMYSDEPLGIPLKVTKKRSQTIVSDEEADFNHNEKIHDILDRERRAERLLQSTDETQVMTTPTRAVSSHHQSQSLSKSKKIPTPFKAQKTVNQPPPAKRQKTGPKLNHRPQHERQTRSRTGTCASTAGPSKTR